MDKPHAAIPAIPLLEQIKIAESNILDDKAYGSEPIREWISAQGSTYTIPPRENAKNYGTCIKNAV